MTTRGSRRHPSVVPPSASKGDISPASSPNALPISSGEGYKSDHPFFVNTSYTLPSGVHVTDSSISRTTSSLAADLFKNCMLRPEVLSALGVHLPTRLHNQFAHYQLRATEASFAMFLKLQIATADAEEHEREKSSFGNLLRIMREKRDSAVAERHRAVEKCKGLVMSHTASEGN
ncbi:hypothetical protein LIER_27015 [Lithospermum erythrorhizon]|uniref:Uncharacterized protein n=1 Tax=Lithospermum erythrorhizon TaxID=34254 RepID=A0AAV3REN0_LITER